jgi:hypothetical protein
MVVNRWGEQEQGGTGSGMAVVWLLIGEESRSGMGQV